jgi:hypothetical protein
MKKKSQESNEGTRLKYVRSLTKYGRGTLSKETCIPLATLRKWESSHSLTKISRHRCIKAFKKLGVIISEDWLKNGVGTEPFISDKIPEDFDMQDLYSNIFRYFKSKSYSSKTYVSYLDRNETLLFVNASYSEMLKIPITQIIGKKLVDIIGCKLHKIQKPYLNKAFAGHTVLYDYNCKNELCDYKFNIACFPDFYDNKKVAGIICIVKHHGPNYSLNIDDILPYVNMKNLTYYKDLYFAVTEAVTDILDQYGVKYDFDALNKLVSSSYAYTLQNNNHVSHEYIDKLISIAINASILSC